MKYQQLQRYKVFPGDVLITIMGTCGRCAVVPDKIPTAINTKHLCCITLDRTKCVPAFLHAYFLGHPIARRYLAQKAKGAIMEGLNMGIIKEMPIPLAPIDLQVKFAARLKQVGQHKAAQRRSEANLEALFGSLQHRAFRGEL
jgi:type I restriction enzyme S subunit